MTKDKYIKDPAGFGTWYFLKFYGFAKHQVADDEWQDIRQIGWLCALQADFIVAGTGRLLSKEYYDFLKYKGIRRIKRKNGKRGWWSPFMRREFTVQQSHIEREDFLESFRLVMEDIMRKYERNFGDRNIKLV